MVDFIDMIIKDVEATIGSDYYDVEPVEHRGVSLKNAILSQDKNPVIAEFKPTSPSKGVLRTGGNFKEVVLSMRRGGAVGVSILTEPKHFNGSIGVFRLARETVDLPLLMKDFVLSRVQVDAASRIGADAVLLIQTLFNRNYTEIGLDDMISLIHYKGMEVLLEVHSEEEFLRAVRTEADMIGVNNRDLATLSIDLKITGKILGKHGDGGKVIVSESGIEDPMHIRLLRSAGAKAFLVGTAVMLAENVEEKVRELVEA